MKKRIWNYWHASLVHALAMLGVEMEETSANAEYEDWMGIGC